MSQRVLVIDDEAHIRRMMRLTLEVAGYQVGEAADGLQGIEMCGAGTAWDVVLLDQKMPGIDGIETLRRLRERAPATRVIMVTAFVSIELAVDAMQLGATDVVEVDPSAVAMVERMIRRPLPIASSFWTSYAEHILATYVWNEGRIPSLPLVITQVERRDVDLAARWEETVR